MRKVFICLLAILIIIPLSAVSVSAASYDLGSPSWFGSWETIAYDEDYVYHTAYTYNNDSGELSAANGVDYNIGIALFPNGKWSASIHSLVNPPLWSFSYVPWYSDYSGIRCKDYDTNNPVLAFSWSRQRAMDVSDLSILCFPAIIYNDIFVPSSGQYLKVSFDFISVQYGSIPSAMNYLMDVSNFCFLAHDNISGGLLRPYEYQFPATVVVDKLSNRSIKYTYYFNLSSVDFNDVPDLDDLSLVVRFPFFFDFQSSLDPLNGVNILTNANIPTTYEILTIGGYDQELAAIENAIISSNQQLVDLYTEQSSEDKTYVIQIKNSNSQLENSVDDYKNAASSVDSIKNDFVLPPLNNTVKDNLEDLDPAEVKDLFSVPWIASAIGLVFSFAIVRLILYGTKEG